MRPNDFLQNRIKNQNIKPVTLLIGEEEYWKYIHKQIILDSYFKDKNEAIINFFSFDAGDSKNDSLILSCIDEANMFGFFGNKKIIVLKNIEKLNSYDQKELINYIEKPNPDTILLLECIELDGRSSLSKHKVLKSETVDYKIESKKDIEEFIKSELKQYGDLTCDSKLKQFLIDNYPDNLRLLSNNIKKIAAYNNFTSPLKLNNIKVLNFSHNEPNIFEFVDKLMQKDLKAALKLYSLFANKKDSVFGIIGQIRLQLQKFLKAKQLKMENHPDSYILQECKIYYKNSDLFLKALSSFTKNELTKKYQKTAETDFLLKSSSIPPNHLFEMLIYYLCA